MERLDKVLAATGRWSRREVKQLVRQGQVRVNGAAAASAEEKVEPETAVITVGGEPVRLQKYTYVMLHKPAGRPSVSLSSRPTGARPIRRSSGGKRSRTVGCFLSSVAVRTPAGLCSIT